MKAKVDIEAAIAAGVDLLVLDGKTLAVHVVAQILAVLIVVRSRPPLIVSILKRIFVDRHYGSRSRRQGLRFCQRRGSRQPHG